MENEVNYSKGVASLGLASVLGATTNVAFASIVQDVHPVVLTLFMVVVSSIVFGVANRGRRPPMNKAAWRAIIGLNFASAGVYIFLIIGLKNLEPAIGAALQAGTTPLITIAVMSVMARRMTASRAERAGGMIVLAGSALLMWVSFSGRSGLGSAGPGAVTIGIVAVLISGLSTVFLTLCSKRLTQLGWSNPAVLAHRFYVTITCCAAISLNANMNWAAVADVSGYLTTVCVAGTGVLLLLQIGIRNVAPFVVLTMTNLNPLITYVVQMFDDRLTVSLNSLVGIAVIFSGLLWVVYTQYRAQQTEKVVLAGDQTR